MSSSSYETSSSEESSGDDKLKVEEEDSSEPEEKEKKEEKEKEKEKEKEPEPTEKPEEVVETLEKDAEASAGAGGAVAEKRESMRGLLDPQDFQELLEEQMEGWVKQQTINCFHVLHRSFVHMVTQHLFRTVTTDQGYSSHREAI